MGSRGWAALQITLLSNKAFGAGLEGVAVPSNNLWYLGEEMGGAQLKFPEYADTRLKAGLHVRRKHKH